MNKNCICLIFGFLFIFCLFGNADPLPKAVNLPSASVAVKDDSMATVTNPAGLGIANGINASYFHTLSGETAEIMPSSSQRRGLASALNSWIKKWSSRNTRFLMDRNSQTAYILELATRGSVPRTKNTTNYRRGI
jgi:hypothetical protein